MDDYDEWFEDICRISLCGYGCHVIGGPFIAENPNCPVHSADEEEE